MPSDATLEHPTCDTADCETEIIGLDDGWEDTDGSLRCTDDWSHWENHGHWPDDDPDHCVECRIDDGAIRHDCLAFDGDVICEPGDECHHCGEEVGDA